MVPASREIFTVGHSTRSLEDFVRLLRRQHIACLIDVRNTPKSRRLPHGPERDRLYHEMTRLIEVDTVWLLTDSRYRNALQQPYVVGYAKHPVLHAEWLYLDLDPRPAH